MWKLTKTIWVGLATVAVVLASSLVAASPAQAYGTVSVRYAEFDTDDCSVFRRSGLQVFTAGSLYCQVVDPTPLGGAFYRTATMWRDANARAVSVSVHSGLELVAYSDFHPYDEIFYIGDTKNDGDTIYAFVTLWSPSNGFTFLGPYSPPGTSNVHDVREVNLNIPDGWQVFVNLYDNADGSDCIGSCNGFAGVA
jgi:hypothetical protein